MLTAAIWLIAAIFPYEPGMTLGNKRFTGLVLLAAAICLTIKVNT